MAGKTIERVPLIRVGTWHASTGETSITRDDLDNILAAFTGGDLDPAVIKIGHTDPRFENPDWDGEPVYGQVTNLSVDDEKGGTLYGDYVNVPDELAEKLDSAYPFRSVEINWDVEMLDAGGEVTATYPAVLTGVALLGASAPAVKGLGTVHSGFRARRTGAKQTVFTASVFAFDGGHSSNSLRKVLQDALENQAEGLGGDRYGCWVADFDDAHVWYEAGHGIYQQGYILAPGGTVTLDAAPLPVVEKRIYEPAESATSDTAAVPQALYRAAESAGNGTPAKAVTPTLEGDNADMAKLNDAQLMKLRPLLGLSDTAPEDEVLAALDADTKPQDAPAPAAAPAAVDAPAAGEGGKDAEPAPAAGVAPAAAEAVAEPTETVKLSAASFAELTASNRTMAAQLADLTAKGDAERRDGLIKSALTSGRLHPTEAPAWRTALDKSEEVTASLLSERAAVFPVTELGTATAPAAFSAATALSEAQIEADNKLFNIGGNK